MANFGSLGYFIKDVVKTIFKNTSTIPPVHTSHPPITLEDKKPKQLISMDRKNKR